MAEFELIADGLRFPEAPVVMDDGSVIVTEIEAGRITRCWPGGRKAVVATPGGGPNGLAIGPDGKLYCCNNGGFEYTESNGYLAPHGIAKDYSGGRIERIDIETGAVEILYKSGDNGVVLRGPNDIMFDSHGGFWFTDHGKVDYEKRCHDIVGIFYAKADGSFIEEVIFPSNNPNGIGISPDGDTLYVSDTVFGRLWSMKILGPGKLKQGPLPKMPGDVVQTLPGYQWLDSLKVEADGRICVGTIFNGGITIFSADGKSIDHLPVSDLFTTNLCFGGADMQDVWITASSTGTIYKTRWERPGLKLQDQAQDWQKS